MLKPADYLKQPCGKTVMKQLMNWLETRWVAPAYSGGLLLGLAVFFFAAASNTMAGWLYVMSGTILAILAIGAVLPERSLRQIKVKRQSILPIYAGEALVVELTILNQGKRVKDLLQITDILPYILDSPQTTVVETILPGRSHHWVYTHQTSQRGVYQWNQVQFRTAAPLGLFWCRRSQTVPAQAVVYPQVLRLSRCPILDEIGDMPHVYVEQYARSNQAHEGFTRALRPYRWGDPIRLVHWRTSARYGELRVRELEILTGGEAVIIALDPDAPWVPDYFEQAVVAAATLFDYGDRNGLNVGLWTAASGVIYPRQDVLTTLAQIRPHETGTHKLPHNLPVIWLTATIPAPVSLPEGSRTLTWPQTVVEAAEHGPSASKPSMTATPASTPLATPAAAATLMIDPLQDLATQLQREP
ncbi:MAG: DUF58 domain-containing protein [Leptolyngbyaceae bacterium]|nr:DUF58 domain-containing protein [Leptolyngbyaceae bacterium]